MLLAAAMSAFCSASEAAFFSLTGNDRSRFRKGNSLQRLAADLASQATKILPTILFCNLSANLVFFSVSTILSLELHESAQHSEAGFFAASTLLGIIIFCEILPKDFGVSMPQRVAPILAVPLFLMVRMIAPLLPLLTRLNILFQRLFFPEIKPEPYLQVSDLERVVELSKKDAMLIKREQRVLQNIVILSELTAEEMMRPRTMLQLYRSPVTLDSLQGKVPDGGYLLITERDNDEIASAIPLDRYTGHESETVWDAESNPVACVPWSMKAAAVLETLHKQKKEVAAVVNEYGETIGILTLDDLMYSIFALLPSRARLLFHRSPIQQRDDNLWHVLGMTGIRRVERYFHVKLPEHDASTVGGVLQEVFERFPVAGDECDWGPFHWKVLHAPEDGTLEIALERMKNENGDVVSTKERPTGAKKHRTDLKFTLKRIDKKHDGGKHGGGGS